MHPAHSLTEAEAPSPAGVVTRGEVLNAEFAEVAFLIPVIASQAFGAAVADPQADQCVGLHRLKTRSKGESRSPHSLHRRDMGPEALPVTVPQKGLLRFSVLKQKIEEDAGAATAAAAVAAVLAGLAHQSL